MPLQRSGSPSAEVWERTGIYTHLICGYEKVQKGLVQVNKILGCEMPATVLTKFVDAKTMSTALNKLNMKFYTGRAHSAPATMGRGETQEPSTQ